MQARLVMDYLLMLMALALVGYLIIAPHLPL